MRARVIGAMAAAVPLLAHAGGPAFYGSIDAGLTQVNDLGGGHVALVGSGNMQPDRLGVRGEEDLGEGYKAVYQLETGFFTDTGAQLNPNKLFNRAAYVGLGNRYATLTIGRQNNFMFDMVARNSNAVVAGTFYAFHPGNIDDLTNAGAYDNAVKLVAMPMAGATLGAILAPGEQAGDSARNRAFSLGANYVEGPLRAAVALSDVRNRALTLGQTTGIRSLLGRTLISGPAASPVYSALAADRVRSIGASASYVAERAVLHALYVQTRITAGAAEATMKSSELGVNFPVWQRFSVNVALSRSTLAGIRWDQFTLNNVYSLSKRTSVYAQAVLQNASGAGAVAAINSIGYASGRTQNALRLGVHQLF